VQYEGSTKTKNRITIGSSDITPRYITESCKPGYNRDTCTPMFTGILFTIAKLWKQSRCPTIDEWIKKMWYIFTMEYYSAIKNKEI
jgi:hypothetical protein